MKYTEKTFLNELDNLENEYIKSETGERSVLEFLDSCAWNNIETFLEIDPIWLTNELNRLNMKNKIGKSGDWSPRMKILMGIIEKFTFVNTPKFKLYDIVRNNKTGKVYIVMNYVRPLANYELDDLEGNGNVFNKTVVETEFDKIGEVTEDVLEMGGWVHEKKTA